MVERAGAVVGSVAAILDRVNVHATMGVAVRCSVVLHVVLSGLRIPALVHASAKTAAFGKIMDLLPAERTSSAAPSLHADKFQCGAAAGGSAVGHITVTRKIQLPAGARFIRAGRSTKRNEKEANALAGSNAFNAFRVVISASSSPSIGRRCRLAFAVGGIRL